jgi:MFS family permease
VNLWRDPKARLVLSANFLLVVGAGITFMAVPWLLIQQPNGQSIFGSANALLTLVIFLLLPYLGKAVDRNSRKAVILAYFGFAIAIDLFVIAALLVQGHVEVWNLLTVFCLGSLGASVYYPAQFAFNQEIFARNQYEALSGAIEIQWQAGAMIAGALGAVLVGRVPLSAILLLDTCAYVSGLCLIALVPYQRAVSNPGGNDRSAWKMMLQGIRYLRQRPRLSLIIFSSFLPFVGLMVANYLAPIFVKNTLTAGPEVYGIGEATYAFGAIVAGLTIPPLNGRVGLIPTLLITVGVFTFAAAAMPSFPSVLTFWIAFSFQGWGNAGSRVARSILVLETVPNEIVGRVNLFYSALERLLRAILLTVATWQVAVGGPKSAYWLIAVISLVGWLLILACRHARMFPVESKFKIEEAQ